MYIRDVHAKDTLTYILLHSMMRCDSIREFRVRISHSHTHAMLDKIYYVIYEFDLD